jgi:phosphopantothenoylcysteine decarboxylase / phosphopantothenate---cysteine ligase
MNGANVHLVTGPVTLEMEDPSVKVTRVESAEEMYNAAVLLFGSCDGAVLTAAVADFTPAEASAQKTKRGKEPWSLKLLPTRDIAAELGRQKTAVQILVGFALETTNELENAREKLQKKNLDFIVLNSLNDEGAGFGVDTNKITIIDRHNNLTNFGLKSKALVAIDIIDKIVTFTGADKN